MMAIPRCCSLGGLEHIAESTGKVAHSKPGGVHRAEIALIAPRLLDLIETCLTLPEATKARISKQIQ